MVGPAVERLANNIVSALRRSAVVAEDGTGSRNPHRPAAMATRHATLIQQDERASLKAPPVQVAAKELAVSFSPESEKDCAHFGISREALREYLTESSDATPRCSQNRFTRSLLPSLII